MPAERHKWKTLFVRMAGKKIKNNKRPQRSAGEEEEKRVGVALHVRHHLTKRIQFPDR